MDEIERRRELAEFLRTRRERLSPRDVGLPHGFRRRAVGLRREEVAQLANIGTSWYTSLEQGRPVNPSEEVLESVARALQLTADERRHLFLLALHSLPARELPIKEQVSLALERMVKALDPHPAYIMDRCWDIVTWNLAAGNIFDFHNIPPPYTRNMFWRIFSDKTIRERYGDWTEMGRGLVAQFRADSVRYPDDERFARLIDDLQRTSEDFRNWWAQHDVLSIPDCHKEMQDPQLGYLEFEFVTLQVPTNPDLRLLVYTANPATLAKLEALLAADQRGQAQELYAGGR
ncbi:transcriptional regulator [Reticulibacter mediterranei]|uniref:Transcriptional regulator n=1 Tax=Reticulibacter mediterranei TaxID=2778369 RepID=A0A8J3IN36_9CHLR|nr:helix-turn-helix transcriptional regulator [Reticulibacter mediterranei]GHO93720.1 transcriptional regulator [Reticulibacter mediterranei]